MDHQRYLNRMRNYIIAFLIGSLLMQVVLPYRSSFGSVESQTEQVAQDVSASTIKSIADEHMIRVGVRNDFGPYGAMGESAECCVGFDVDIAREFARRWLNDENALQLIPVSATDRINRLIGGEFHLVLAAMTHSRPRDEGIDFSQSYFQDGLQFLVRKGSSISINNLGGQQIGAVQETTGFTWLTNLPEESGIERRASFASYDDAINALESDEIDALVSDGGGLRYRTRDNDALVVVGDPFTIDYYGVGVRQGDSAMRELVNFTLQAMKEDGTYDRIYQNWFGTKEPFPIEVIPGKKDFQIASYENNLPDLESSIIEKLLKAEIIRIGVSDRIGFNADIGREFVHRWLGRDVDPILLTVSTDAGLRDLADGKIDLLIASTIPSWNREQKSNVDFSQVYAADEVAILTRSESTINRPADLAGQRVAVLDDSAAVEWLASQQSLYEFTIELFSSDDEAVSRLQTDDFDAVVGDAERLSSWAAQDDNLTMLDERYPVPYAIAVPNGDYRLRELVNFTLQAMKADGYYDCLYQKWYPRREIYPIEILSGEEDYLGINYQREDDESCLPIPTIQRVRERGKLLAGVQTDFPPMGFEDGDGKPAGFDIDLVNALADLWGVTVEFVPLLSNERITFLEEGEVDLIAAGMTHTRDRDAAIDFSQTYFLDGQRLLVQRNSEITEPIDLKNKRVAAIQGTTSIQEIQAFADNKNITITIVPFLEHSFAIDALENGSVDAFTTDGIALQEFAKRYQNLVVVGEPFTREPYGIGVRAGDSAFRHLVDFTLEQLKRNGTYDEIYQKWVLDGEAYPIEILPGEWSGTLNDTQDPFDPDRSIIQKMQREKQIIVGIMEYFPPFGMLDVNGICCIGFDADIVKELAKRWLGDDSEATIKFVPLVPDDRILAIVQGEVDLVAGGMTITWEREQKIDFSQTYFLDGQSLLVKNKEEITGLDDLQGKRLGAVQGSTSLATLEKSKQEKGYEIVPFLDHQAAIESLMDGTIDAFSSDKAALLSYAKENSGLFVVGQTFTFEPYGIGIPENDHQLRDLINSTLQEMWLDGTYRRLHDRWLSEVDVSDIEIWPRKVYAGHIGFSQAPMVLIPAGEFTRGDEEGESDERPAKQITIDAFYIDQYEVTNRLYRECVSSKVCTPPQKLYSLQERGDYYNNVDRYGNYPVIWITWEQADTYCKYLGKRLPTEAEWEKAARGPEEHSYPWGDELLSEVQDTFENRRDTVFVGSTPLDISGYNVYDMAGNVLEWVSDYYDPNYYQENITQNPRGPRTAVRKAVRGGAWDSSQPKLWRNANRGGYRAINNAHNLGFRCASNQSPIELLPAQP